jgi:hypothetical protein
VVWKRKGEIAPRYAKLSAENLEAANGLIEAYKGHIGEKKKVLKALWSLTLKMGVSSIGLLGGWLCCLIEEALSLAAAKSTLLI